MSDSRSDKGYHSQDYNDLTIKAQNTKDDSKLEEKLIGLFKSIYSKDPNLESVKKDAFQYMMDQKVTGNICPHIKKAIQNCLKDKKESLQKLWIEELAESFDGANRLKDFRGNVKEYAKIMRELIDVYNLYDESVDKIVEVWKAMLSDSNSLKKTFHLLIMTEFDENIWNDVSIKVVIEEIINNESYLGDYSEDLSKFKEINDSMNSIKDNYTKTEPQSKPVKSCTSEPHKTKPKGKKKNKGKEKLINGVNPDNMEIDSLVDYINGKPSK